jgi:hypothetical protein
MWSELEDEISADESFLVSAEDLGELREEIRLALSPALSPSGRRSCKRSLRRSG